MTEIFQDYKGGDITSEAFIAYEGEGKKPAVLISHAWAGQGDFDQNIARNLAKLGYVGIAIDVYGKGVRGNPAGDNSHLMMPLVEDRAKLLGRLTGALKFAQGLNIVDKNKIAIIGFCFGGMCAMDLARSGTDEIKAAISFHGLFYPNGLDNDGDIKAKVLACHGFNDPLALPDAMVDWCKEMTARNADWQLHAFGGTSHAFTNPHAKNHDAGLVYNEKSAKRAFALMEAHLKEAFAD